MPSSKPGTSTSKADPRLKRPSDPLDRLIHEQGLRIKDVYIDKSLDLLLLVLNNGEVLRSGIAEHERLRDASPAKLKQWQLIGAGTGITWPQLNEDLSLRGFIQASSLQRVLRDLGSIKVSSSVRKMRPLKTTKSR